MNKLNIGCGEIIKEGFTNLDVYQAGNVDIIHDLNSFPYPFLENTFEEVNADDVLEHLNEIPKPIEELHRICKKGAIIKIKVPIFPSEQMFDNPTHKLIFTRNTFDYFSNSELYYQNKAKFKIKERRIYFYYPCSSRFPVKQIGKIYTYLVSKFKLIENIYFNFSPFIIKPKFMKITLEVIK